MLEPFLENHATGVIVPLSNAPLDDLKQLSLRDEEYTKSYPEEDMDFVSRYAAILLMERT